MQHLRTSSISWSIWLYNVAMEKAMYIYSTKSSSAWHVGKSNKRSNIYILNKKLYWHDMMEEAMRHCGKKQWRTEVFFVEVGTFNLSQDWVIFFPFFLILPLFTAVVFPITTKDPNVSQMWFVYDYPFHLSLPSQLALFGFCVDQCCP